MEPENRYTKDLDILPQTLSKTGYKKTTVVLLCLALVFITLAVYMQVGNHSFINLDDTSYVTENHHVIKGITGQNIIWAFTSVEAYNWHPVTWLSHMADVQFFGMNPRGHHLTNVVIHTISTLFLFFFLLRLTGDTWPSSFVSALFALHPLHVESVAWVAERKDVLSGFFCFLTLLLYAEYVKKRKTALYILTLFTFILGLMSKSMLVTLPIVMLLLDVWPLNRYQSRELQQREYQLSSNLLPLLKEKIPFFICSLFSGIITIYAQNKGGALASLNVAPFWHRFENAVISYSSYIYKTLWPHHLAVYYPSHSSIPLWQIIGSLAILLSVSFAVLWVLQRKPYLAVGWFWFLITLLPVIGLIQVGSQSMADRYSYIPIIGIFIMVTWGSIDLVKGVRFRKVILCLPATAIIAGIIVLSCQQLVYWQDSVSLFRHTLNVTKDNSIIHNNLGITIAKEGKFSEAIQEYRKALLIDPNYSDAHNNLGQAYENMGLQGMAIQEFIEALKIKPDNAQAHYNLGAVFHVRGEVNMAIKEYQEALLINPNHVNAHNNLGAAYVSTGNINAAINEYKEALKISPQDIRANSNLKNVLTEQGKQIETKN